MFRHCPTSLFWLVAVLIGGCLLAAEVTAFGRSFDPIAIQVAGFAFLGLLATSAYPFTRNSQLFLGLALFASAIQIARIVLGADGGDAVRIWLAAVGTSLATLLLVATIRKLFGRRLALPAPASRQPWHSHVARPALIVSLALTVTLLFSPRPLIEVADSDVLRIPLGDIMGLEDEFADPPDDGREPAIATGIGPGSGESAAQGLKIAVLSDRQLLPQFDNISAVTLDEAALSGIGNPQSRAATERNAGLGSISALDYDLGGQLRSNGTIRVSKPLKIADRDTGELTLLIDPNSQIFADFGQISAIMPDLAGALEATEGRFVSFSELRRSGIAISYDAVRDVVVISN